MSANPPSGMKIGVEVPQDLDAVYSNFVIISHSPSEIVMDFAVLLPNSPRARVRARVLTTPLHAKLLLRALQEHIGRYEAQYGEVRLPPEGDELARQFFGGARPPEK